MERGLDKAELKILCRIIHSLTIIQNGLDIVKQIYNSLYNKIDKINYAEVYIIYDILV